MACRTVTAMEPIAVTREGEGPEIPFVHGGASAGTTWRGLDPLKERWTLAFVHRRGYSPSPPEPEGRHDFDVDAADLLPLLDDRPHVVAHSYGTLGALIAAGSRPEGVRSLTLIEPPLYLVDDPEVERFKRMGDEVLAHGLDTDPGDAAGVPAHRGGARRRRAALGGGRPRSSARPRRTPSRRGEAGPRHAAERRSPDPRRIRRPRAGA